MRDSGFPVELAGGVPVVAAPAEIDITNAEALRSALLTAAANGPGTLVVDMTLTRFCDSAGLHTLIAAHRRARADGGEVRLVIPGIPVLRVFALTGMDRAIPNFTTLAEALAQRPPPQTADAAAPKEMPVPKTSRYRQLPAGELPGTLKRSPQEAQDMFTRALASAVVKHGEGDQAVRAAYAELKRTFEKRGDHWIPKQHQPR